MAKQLAEMKANFVYFDKDKDDTCQSKELGTVMRCLGANPTDAEVREYVKEFDPEGRGSISFKDFCTCMQKQAKKKQIDADVLQKSFKTWDREGKGYIKVDDAKTALKTTAEKLTDAEIDAFIKISGADGGLIPIDNVIKVLMK